MHTICEDIISSNSRLLILSCSQKKRSNPGSIPALKRYDGPAFRVMNKFIRTLKDEEIHLNAYQDIHEARERIGHFITRGSNEKRPHSVFNISCIHSQKPILNLLPYFR